MQHKNLLFSFLFIIILQISGLTVIGQAPVTKKGSKSKSSAVQRKIEIKIYFTNPNLPEWKDTCTAGEFVTRKIPATKRVADMALKLVFAGPTAKEKEKGMKSITPLSDFYIGVSIKSETAIINFRSGAEKYLHVLGPICMQQIWLAPMTQTLKRFKNIKTVQYAIDGKIIDDWDA